MIDLAHLVVPAGVRSRSINAENPSGAVAGMTAITQLRTTAHDLPRAPLKVISET